MKTKRLILLFLCGLSTACGASKSMEPQLARLERGQADLSNKQTDLSERMDELSNSIMVLQDRLETLQLAQARNPSLPMQMPTAVAQALERAKPEPKKVERRPAPEPTEEPFLFEGDPGNRSLPTLSLSNDDLSRMEKRTEASKPAAPVASREESDAAKEYNDAFALFEHEKYAEAAGAFERFLTKYPTHSYADNARFWMGECYFRQQNFARAAESFEHVARDFPTGNKVPDALLRAGSCYLRLAQTERAKKSFERVVQLYPQSVAAQKARNLIAELSGNATQRRM